MESHLLTELGNENFIEIILKVLKSILTKIGMPEEDEELRSFILYFLVKWKGEAPVESYFSKYKPPKSQNGLVITPINICTLIIKLIAINKGYMLLG
ncbi:hypothetical protein [Clostridium sp.]|uniref:hypothetical protein n=1 Tax=Clostridium sp. TaxID=1506 RepID=UPI0025BBC088|nr:hypothetical protein [Clostridium sp.]